MQLGDGVPLFLYKEIKVRKGRFSEGAFQIRGILGRSFFLFLFLAGALPKKMHEIWRCEEEHLALTLQGWNSA